MRISKERARIIAGKMTEKSKLESERLDNEYDELVVSLYEAQTPKEVKDCFAKHPDWFATTHTVHYIGYGFDYSQAAGKRNVICNADDQANLILNHAMAEKISKVRVKADKAKNAYRLLKSETEQALIALGTHAKIKEAFPEAAPFLPIELSHTLVVNFDSLKLKLKRQPDVKKEVVK